MNYYPLIYSDRKQLGFDFESNSSEIISLSASITDSGYQWSFYPESFVEVVSGSISGQQISCQVSGEYYPVIHAVWSNPLDENVPADDLEILIYNPEILQDTESPRAFYERLYFPYTLDETFVAINDFTTDNSINPSLEKLYANFNYLLSKCKYVDRPLTELAFRYGESNSPYTSGLGYQWQQVSPEYAPSANNYWEYSNPFSADLISVNSNYTLYVTNGDTLNILSNKAGSDPSVVSRGHALFSSDPFSNIKSVVLEEDNNIWVLEYSGRLSRLKYDGKWTFISSTPNVGISASRITISDSKLYIVTENQTNYLDQIHIFDYSLNSLGIIYNESIETILGVAVTRDYIVVLDDQNNMHFFGKDDLLLKRTGSASEYIFKYDPQSVQLVGSDIYNVYNCQDDYYFFVTTENLIYKFSQDGGLIGFGGIEAVTTAYNDSNIQEYTIIDAFQDINNNIYVLSNYDILKYYESAYYDYSIIRNSEFNQTASFWSLEDIKIDSEEYCSYWVYNRAFNRLYDNFVLYLNVITGKLYNTGYNVVTKGFSIDELGQLPHSKDEIYIGINELHSEAAINRNIRKLYDCLQVLLDTSNLKSFEDQVDGDIIWNGSYIFDGSILFSG